MITDNNGASVSKAQFLYGSIVYWITLISALICIIGPPLALVRTGNNVLNPHHLFAAIWKGEGVDAIWQDAGFTGGHFYLDHLFTGDGFIQFGIALGCSAALWGLLAASWEYCKERSYGYAIAALFISAVIIFAMLGVIALK